MITMVTFSSLVVLERVSEDAFTRTGSALSRSSVGTLPPTTADPWTGDVGGSTTTATTTTTAPQPAPSTTVPDGPEVAPPVEQTQGNVEVVGANPDDVDLSSDATAYDHDNKVFVFVEGRIVLDEQWPVPGSSPAVVLDAGDAVCAYYLHYSPRSRSGGRPGRSTIEFAGPILGWVGDETGLDGTDDWSGSPHPAGPVYDSGNRRIEPGERVTIDGSSLGLHGLASAHDASDDLRVFTAC